MFRPVLSLSSGISIQKPYTGKYKNILSAPIVEVNLDPGPIWKIGSLILRNQLSNNTLFAQYRLELHFSTFLFSFFYQLNE